MASKRAVLPLLGPELRATPRVSKASASLLIVASSFRGQSSPLALRRTRHTALFRTQSSSQIRSTSQSSLRNLTDEDGHLDPRQVERESDEVDVCIVGGGMNVIKLVQTAQN